MSGHLQDVFAQLQIDTEILNHKRAAAAVDEARAHMARWAAG